MGKWDGRPRSAGKNAAKYNAYRSSGRQDRKKLRRVIQSSGFEAGVWWAKANGCEGILAAFEKARNDRGQPLRWLERVRVNGEPGGATRPELPIAATPEQKQAARQLLATT